ILGVVDMSVGALSYGSAEQIRSAGRRHAAAGPGGETPALSRVLPQGGRGGRADTAMPASTVRVSDGDPWHGLVPSGWGVPPYNSPMTTYPTVQLKNAWRSSHPWIFQKIVQKP